MHTPPLGVIIKFGTPHLEGALKNRYPSPGCRKLIRAAGANRAKGASRNAEQSLNLRGKIATSISSYKNVVLNVSELEFQGIMVCLQKLDV